MTNQNETDSELLLQGLIEECRQIIRDVVVPAARDARDCDERRRYLNSAVDLVRIGATVGESIARVRGGTTQQTHHHITVDRVVHALPAPGKGEGV
jgi:hypothetical protein